MLYVTPLISKVLRLYAVTGDTDRAYTMINDFIVHPPWLGLAAVCVMPAFRRGIRRNAWRTLLSAS